MKRLLLDTHALVWALENNPKLSKTAEAFIEEPHADLTVSVASLWEIAIKHALGKLKLDIAIEALVDTLEKRQIKILPIDAVDALKVATLPHHHGDPFDRMLVAHTINHRFTIISRDPLLDSYGIDRVW